MRVLLTILFLILLHSCLSAQVVIREKTAEFFLEAHDSLQIYKSRDTLYQQLVANKDQQLLVKDSIIDTYKEDSTLYDLQETTFLEQLRYKEGETDELRRKNRKLTLLGILELVVIIFILL